MGESFNANLSSSPILAIRAHTQRYRPSSRWPIETAVQQPSIGKRLVPSFCAFSSSLEPITILNVIIKFQTGSRYLTNEGHNSSRYLSTVIGYEPINKSNLPLKFSIRLVYLDTPRDLSTSSHNAPLARYKSQDLGSIFCRDLAPPPSAGISAPSETGRAGFGIRGAARGFANVAPTSEAPSWGRSGAAPRWGGAPDRRGGRELSKLLIHPITVDGVTIQSLIQNELMAVFREVGNDRYRDRVGPERGGPRWASNAPPRRDSRERSPPRRRR
ncbi:hypothetical protein H4Q26_018262 [Puccinia striiformis f. sp. tritici PST-130]|nr:hypothetical protein H4Q26_018262 [Puccinia striiformis f. sp. tritici PST-130]